MKRNGSAAAAGVGLHDHQIEKEIRRTIDQMLRIYGETADRYRVDIQVADGDVVLAGELPDLGTRRVVLQAALDIPAVVRVDSARLLPESLLD